MYQVNTMRGKGIKQVGEKMKRGRPKVARPMKRVNISVDPADYEAIERLATANGMSSAMLIRLAMKDLLGRQRKGKPFAMPFAEAREG